MSDSHSEVTTLIYPDYCRQLSREKIAYKTLMMLERDREKKKKMDLSKETLRDDQFNTQT